jgi:aerobic carbon-monoxide dehydrogenase medium subunit
MKPASFRYRLVGDREEAVRILAEEGEDARVLAGGQSLIPMLNLRLARPSVLVDVNRIADLGGISQDGGTIRIGALTRHAVLGANPLIRARLSVVADAIGHVAHPAIRNRGTIGGSLALADPAAELPACCLAFDARMHLESLRGIRTVPADAFFRGIFETALAPDELLAAVEIPDPAPGWHAAFGEMARRSGDYALCGSVARVRMDAGRVAEARLVFFGMGPRPLRAHAAETVVCQGGTGADAARAAAEALRHDLDPFDDQHATGATRLHLAGVLLRRLLIDLHAKTESRS